MVVGPADITPIVSYYARRSPYYTFGWEATDASILGLVDRSRAEVVLLRPARQLTAAAMRSLRERMLRSGLGPLRPEIPPGNEIATWMSSCGAKR